MKNSSKLLLLALSAGLCVTPLIRAQDESKPANDPTLSEHHEKMRGHMKERGEHIADVLGLTADQKAKMKGINQQEHAALETVRADGSLSKEQKKAKAQEIHQSFASQRDAILTPEQKAKADQMRAAAKEHREHHQGGGDAK